MAVSQNLRNLIDAAAPLWAGEAEVVRAYWDSPVRNLETDLLWIARQASKEFNGSGAAEYKNLGVFLGPLTELMEMFPRIDVDVSRHEAYERIEMIHEEFAHYIAFADLHDAIRGPDTPPLNPHKVLAWDEDTALMARRHAYIESDGDLGKRATKFSEGGYCTLFREGMRLKGRGGNDELIAECCGKIYDDEFHHMLSGVIGMDDENLSDAEWARMTEMVTEILRHRIHMRNGEFSFPLSQERIAAIFAGDIQPEQFDYGRAEEALAH